MPDEIIPADAVPVQYERDPRDVAILEDLIALAKAVEDQHGITLVQAMKDLLRTRALDVTLD